MCAEAVNQDVCVTWMGTPDAIVLHPVCAEKLGVHLIKDSREAEIAGGTANWTRRGIRAVRAGLVAQEMGPTSSVRQQASG
jgi:hypothetical protein